MDPKSRTLPTPGFLVALLEMYPENFTIFLHTESLPNGEKKAFTIVSNTDLKEEGVTPGADTRHGKFVISSCSLSARDKFPFEALPIEPVGAFLVPRGDDSVDLEAQYATPLPASPRYTRSTKSA